MPRCGSPAARSGSPHMREGSNASCQPAPQTVKPDEQWCQPENASRRERNKEVAGLVCSNGFRIGAEGRSKRCGAALHLLVDQCRAPWLLLACCRAFLDPIRHPSEVAARSARRDRVARRRRGSAEPGRIGSDHVASLVRRGILQLILTDPVRGPVGPMRRDRTRTAPEGRSTPDRYAEVARPPCCAPIRRQATSDRVLATRPGPLQFIHR